MIDGTGQIVVEDNQRARIKTTGFLQIKVSQKGLGKSNWSVVAVLCFLATRLLLLCFVYSFCN